MMIALFILFMLSVVILNICMAQFGKAGVLSVFITFCLIVCGARIHEYLNKVPCESILPRNQSCVVIAVPEDKLKQVEEMLK